MAKAIFHAKSSAKRFGGKSEDYFEIHDFMDCSKGAFPDNRHRCLTHQSWFIKEVIERVHFRNSGPMMPDGRFPTIINSDGKEISVREIAELHVLEDFRMKFIPTVSDYINGMEMHLWMNAMPDYYPESHKKIANKLVKTSD